MNASIARFVVLIVAVVNAVLNLIGYETIPETLTNDLVAITSGAYILYMGWKNNYMSKKGKLQKETLDRHRLS